MEIMKFFVLITLLISFCAIESAGKTTEGKEKVIMTFDPQEHPLRTLLRCLQEFSIITEHSISVVAQIRVRLNNAKKGFNKDNPVNDLYTAAHSIDDLKKYLGNQMTGTLVPNKALNSALGGLKKLSIPNTFFEKLDRINETTLKNALVELIHGQIASSSNSNANH